MCTFLSTLPKKSKTAGTTENKRNLVMFLKPCPDNDGQPTWYRVRLLNFGSKTSTRDYPFIARYVHQKWGVNAKGFNVVEREVVCPVTKWVEWDGDRYNDCPICRYAGQQFGVYKESGYRDKDAMKKNKEFGRKFQGIIPVYVVDDPNYEGNKGKYKVIILNDKSVYDDFVKKVEKQLLKANCFNGKNAVDCLLHVAIVDKVRNEGEPNEYRWKQKEIDDIRFLKAEKAYDLPAITKEAVDAFPFDDEYYQPATASDLKEFYDTYIKVSLSNDDIDSDDDDVPVYDAPKAEKVVKTNKPKDEDIADVVVPPVSDDDVDDLAKDPDEEGLEVKESASDPAPAAQSSDDMDIDSLLKDID